MRITIFHLSKVLLRWRTIYVLILTPLIILRKTASTLNSAVEDVIFRQEHCIQDEFNYTSVKGCKCYSFQSGYQKEGRFFSPNFPLRYPAHLPCLLYTFIADQDELVHLQFSNFNMRPKVNQTCIDVVRLHLNLERAELNLKDKPQVELCGEMNNLEQTEFYSANRVVIMELQTDMRTGFTNYLFNGFQGKYSFQRRKQYSQSESADPPSSKELCDFHFNSSVKKFGRVFSPQYPQNYPNATRCVYRFHALPSERVVLEMKSVSLETNEKADCAGNSPADEILVYEGLSEAGDIIRRFRSRCGQRNNEQAVSDGSELYVVFQSDGNGKQAKGFYATYRFVEKHKVIPTLIFERQLPTSASMAVRINNTLHWSDNSMSVQQNYSSIIKSTGFFTSPNFPHPYPPSIIVIYRFRGLPGQRVILSFQEIHLGNTHVARCSSDYRGDRLIIYDGMSVNQLILQQLCGRSSPEKIWSTGEHVTVKFISDDVHDASLRGFRALYKFERVEEKAFSDADKLDAAAIEKIASNCSIEIISDLEHRDGTLKTPGYPDFYPDGLHCQWRFIGKKNERVWIQFTDFDVASRVTARHVTKSCIGADIITVTKWRALIPSFNLLKEEFCGNLETPFSILSTEQSYLEVLFKSGQSSRGHRGIKLRYAFVTNYAVHAPMARQVAAECRFIFDAQQSRQGNFTSPNYPSKYPESVTCYYEFHGVPGDHIRIEFAKFNVETTSRRCDNDVDYVTAMTCGQKLNSAKGRLCGAPDGPAPYTIEWSDSCGVMAFHSNEQYTRSGFLGRYQFLRITTASNMNSCGVGRRDLMSNYYQCSLLLFLFLWT